MFLRRELYGKVINGPECPMELKLVSSKVKYKLRPYSYLAASTLITVLCSLFLKSLIQSKKKKDIF